MQKSKLEKFEAKEGFDVLLVAWKWREPHGKQEKEWILAMNGKLSL